MRGAKVETKNIDQRHQVNSYWHINKAHVSNLVDTLKVDIAPETAQNCALIHVFKYRKTRLIVITSLIFCLVGCSQRSANYTVIHAFNVGERGGGPMGGLLMGNNGNLYGTTAFDGTNHDGTVFKIATNGKETILYSFKCGTDGVYPKAGLVMDSTGSLYGTTSEGGTSDAGTVFKITPTGKIRILYSFKGGTYGENPKGGLIFGSDANLFGTTTYGGNGVVFEVTPQGSERILHTFGDGSKGACPETGLVISRRGNLYGTTPSGGAHLKGVIFKIRT